MNRREEYWVLTEQLRREPPDMESAVRRGWTAPGGGAGGQRSCWPDWLVCAPLSW